MNQQINLYQPILRRERRLFSAAAILKSCALCALGLLLISVFIVAASMRQQAELGRLEVQRDQLTRRLNEIARELAPRDEQRDLTTEIRRLEAEIEAKQIFLSGVDPQGLGNRRGFAELLEALARRPVEGLWLRELYLGGDGRVAFHGSASDAQVIPDFLAGLSAQSVFRGYQFHSLKVQRAADGRRVDFVLETSGERQ